MLNSAVRALSRPYLGSLMRAENITRDDQHNSAKTGRPRSTHLVAVCLARNSCYSVHGCSAIRRMSSALAFQNLVFLENGMDNFDVAGSMSSGTGCTDVFERAGGLNCAALGNVPGVFKLRKSIGRDGHKKETPDAQRETAEAPQRQLVIILGGRDKDKSSRRRKRTRSIAESSRAHNKTRH